MEATEDGPARPVEEIDDANGRTAMELTAWSSAREMITAMSGWRAATMGTGPVPNRPRPSPHPARRPRRQAGPGAGRSRRPASWPRHGHSAVGAPMPGLVDMAALYLLARADKAGPGQ